MTTTMCYGASGAMVAVSAHNGEDAIKLSHYNFKIMGIIARGDRLNKCSSRKHIFIAGCWAIYVCVVSRAALASFIF